MNFNTQSKTRQCLQPNVFLLHRSDMGETTGGPRFVIRSILRALTLPGCSSGILESDFTGNIIKHVYGCIYIYIYIYIYMDQPGKVANSARGQPNRENKDFPVPVRA